MADRATKNMPEKLFTWHIKALMMGADLISQREDVRDNREIVSPMTSSLESA